VLGVASRDFCSPWPNWSPAGDLDGKGTASIQPRNHRGNAGAQLRVRLWKIFRDSQDSVCRPARRENSEPDLKGHFRNAGAIRKA
jgi:hypothetical protein